MEGNQMKMREALEAIWKEVYFYAIEEDKQDFAHLHEAMLEDPPEYKDLRNSFFAIAHLVDAALALPLRQCDVGTAEEQFDGFAKHCIDKDCDSCEHGIRGRSLAHCALRWAQTPYAAELKKDGKGNGAR